MAELVDALVLETSGPRPCWFDSNHTYHSGTIKVTSVLWKHAIGWFDSSFRYQKTINACPALGASLAPNQGVLSSILRGHATDVTVVIISKWLWL